MTKPLPVTHEKTRNSNAEMNKCLHSVDHENSKELGVFKNTKIRMFSNMQIIDEIRKRGEKFVDNEFKSSIKLLIKDPGDDMVSVFANFFGCKNEPTMILKDLSNMIKFKRCKVIFVSC